MKKTSMILLTLALCSALFAGGVAGAVDGYLLTLVRYLAIFDESERETAVWGAKETLKAELEAASKTPGSGIEGARIVAVAFFRNEGRKRFSVCDEFTVAETGEYHFTMLNGNPSDPRSNVSSVTISIAGPQGLSKVLKKESLLRGATVEAVYKLEGGARYTLVAEELAPLASYVTVIVSDRKIIK